MTRKLNRDISYNEEKLKNFIERSKIVHNNKYSYEKTEYVTCEVKLIITCPNHGDFPQLPSHHLKGHGCKLCCYKKIKCDRSKTIEQFIEESKMVHGTKYNYSNLIYQNTHSKVEIICPVHGSFWQIAKHHLNGSGCQKCYDEHRSIKQRKSQEDFINEARQVHQSKYDYSNTIYVNSNTKIEIICKIHGSYWQVPYLHLRSNCPKCSNETKIRTKITTEVFIKRAIEEHGNLYDYSDVEYVNMHKKVKIKCNKCKTVIFQRAQCHLKGHGCQKCYASYGERKIRKLLINLNISFEEQKRFKDCINPKTNRKLMFDFYLPEYNICVEYDGKHHYEPSKRIYDIEKSKKMFENSKFRDEIKNKYCLEKNIKLIRIPYYEKIENYLNQNTIK